LSLCDAQRTFSLQTAGRVYVVLTFEILSQMLGVLPLKWQKTISLSLKRLAGDETMTRNMQNLLRAGCTTAMLITLSANVLAQEVKLRSPAGGVPRLGFTSYFNGQGEAVTRVLSGTAASRVGLEPGDVIVAVNGERLLTYGAWDREISNAAIQGHVVLAIRDWRTGQTAFRHFDFGGLSLVRMSRQ
jgi:hypothetical protein